MKTPESYEKDAIKKYLKEIGAWYTMPYMAGYGASGTPDLVCCIKGMFFGIEVKREGKEPTPRQLTRMKEIEDAGGFAVAGTAEVVIKFIRAAISETDA